MTRRLISASVLHLMLVKGGYVGGGDRGGCVGVREGEKVLTVQSSADKQQNPQMNQHCVPDSRLVVNDGAVNPVNPDILDVAPLGSEVRPSDCDLCPPKLWAGLWIEL